MLKSINPATEKTISTFPIMQSDEVNSILELTDTAHNQWKNTNFDLRSKLMQKAANVLAENIDEYSKLMTDEMGKPIVQSRSEVEKCAWVCEYYAENAEKFLTDEIIKTDASKSYVSFQPFGVVLAVMPWNFPFWQVFRFAVPNLMAGNGGILKHASNVSGCALAIEDVFRKAGFPDHIFRTILLPSSQMEKVIRNDKVKAVTLTGSVPAGKSVAKTAGSVLKKTVMELGGSDPYLILEDADLELAADTCVNSRLINGGQSCIAAKRFIAVEKIYNEFEKLFVEKMNSKNMGDPFDEQNDLGPQASLQLRDELHEQVKKSIEIGANLLLGGEIPERKGAFYPATVLSNIKKGMPAYDEELFGPVAALIKAKDLDDSLEIANNSSFGLGAAIFSSDANKAEKIAKEKLNAGSCFVNAFVKSDPRLPFGGIKESGYGRELSVFGIREFVNIKSVYVK
ncbi:MAG: NAD-dependent succinate-semialdehyde dehydrogenase [Ignavibacteria bacterium]|nr:NAD-dependent succinate-semialdehyde dehydrogenase [Ignavibacteria bacterium]MBT8383032.1 NAD-dependent succinate-semialdehyde dehydrogenase [Ignavibacteria bacterium]